MKNIAIICGLAASLSMGMELPVCEEFEGENITCERSDHAAVILTTHDDGGKTLEFFHSVKNNTKKAYMEISADGSLYASSGKRHLYLSRIPTAEDGAEAAEAFLYEVLLSVVDDIGFGD